MKYTPEVTTALARIAEHLARDKDFKELSYESRRFILRFVETHYPKYWCLEEEQYKESSERFNKTIRLPWFHSEV